MMEQVARQSAGMALLRAMVRSQVFLSRSFDRRLPETFQRDGNREFRDRIVPCSLKPGATVFDIGGGKCPCIPLALKSKLDLRVVGIDISADELARAPAGAYDRTIVCGVEDLKEVSAADSVICQALLEHVPNVELAFRGIARCLRPGGTALIFVPSRKAWYARLNRLLPESWKRALLFSLFPHTRHTQGFPSYYDRCSPGEFRALSQQCNLSVRELIPYYRSSYFSFCFPLYVLWRVSVLVRYTLFGEEAAETFVVILEKGS